MTPPKMGVRPCSRKEHQCGGKLAVVKISLYLRRRESGKVHNKLSSFSK